MNKKKKNAFFTILFLLTDTLPWRRSASSSTPSSLSSSHYHSPYPSPSSTQERAGNERWVSSIPTRTTAAAARESSGAPSKPSKRKLPISTASSSPEITTLPPTAYPAAPWIDSASIFSLLPRSSPLSPLSL